MSVGGVGTAPGPLSLLFTSEHAATRFDQEDFDTTRRLVPVRGTRGLTTHDMVHNEATPAVLVDLHTHECTSTAVS